ncbi:aminoacyl-tRNA hydrolase [Paenibacillus dendritiformis]|uniref:aminoacyl-tRNA hydrolase n=1 Tax=Paenibacillus TaxID=44249 RepID=UPI000DA75BFC|nr:aminoacyl-tRNA hydrolase [Paenibacillus dendritiformis]PZM64221.1 aminoacyl-tRNA hydrolase [Paenibacillus dendritiformis]TDL47470.1 aminoacyl-tRNA hydrolase [Paenibacillus dendritiformis]WGU93290.1 aminoacyl-tRNA hydrolase [Paenibacillus dendritiformis]
MKWIVGLGNPGMQYASTRHNIGFMAVDRLAERHQIQVRDSKCKALIGEGRVGTEKIVLIKPMTYMNLSGEAVRAYMDYYKADPADLIVLYDDMDTELGKVRLRYQGSSGGHNGIKSLIQHLGTQTFNRVRMGISRPQPGREIVDYVLSPFAKAERDKLEEAIDKTCDAVEFALTHPFDQTMAKFNG